MALQYFDEITEFSSFQAIQALFWKKLNIKVLTFETKVALEVYAINNCFLKTILMPLEPSKEQMQQLISELESLLPATNQL